MAENYALIIGVGKYKYLRPLNKTTTDAQDLYNLLVERGYPETNIAILLDDEATKAAIGDVFDWLARNDPTDGTVLIFFAGHGVQRMGGFAPGEYLCPVEANWDYLRGTAISNEEFTTALNAIRAERLVVFMDACHSGGVSRTTRGMANVQDGLSQKTYEQLAGKGRVVIASCGPDEVSYELPGMRNGLFSHYLLEGIRSAVVDDEGLVRVLRLYSYLSQQVPTCQKDQHPLLKTEASGDIILCHSAQPAPKLTPPVESEKPETEQETLAEVMPKKPMVKPASSPPRGAHTGQPGQTKILWVDDEILSSHYNQRMKKRLESELGIRVTPSLTTEDALTKLKSNKYDVIISDMGRPLDRRAGYTLLKEIRKLKIDTPYIIWARGGSRPEHKAEAHRLGAFDSTDGTKLLEVVKKAIERG